VGRAFSAALAAAGVAVRSFQRGAGPPLAGAGKGADAIILAVRDQAIAEAAEQVMQESGAGQEAVLLHCAGSIPPGEVLAGQVGRVRGVGLLHPLRSLSSADPAPSLRGAVMAICGDEAARSVAEDLALRVGGRPLRLEPEQLAAYHAAAVMAAGHVAALLDQAAQVLTGVGLPRRQAEEALGQLCASAARNVEAVGLPAALTGPFARGDAGTVARHLRALPAEAAALYRAVAPYALDVARRKGSAPAEALERIAALLRPPGDGNGEGP
jgi:predicted short-subunit dehydrogenase-like oxidoreductase (DUF2520 family)